MVPTFAASLPGILATTEGIKRWTRSTSRFVQRMRDLDRGAHLSELAQQLNTRCPGLMATLGTEDREDLVAPAKP